MACARMNFTFTCFIAMNVSEQYQSQVHRPLENLQLKHSHNVIHVFAQVVVAESYTLARRMPTPCYLPSLNTFRVSIDQNYAVKKINIRGNVVDSKIQTCVKKYALNCLKEGEMYLI